MSEFTPGKWWIAPPIFDGDAIFAPPQEKGRRWEVVATGITNKADARLIVAAPELYKLVSVFAGLRPECDTFFAMAYARKLIARIDGEDSDTGVQTQSPDS